MPLIQSLRPISTFQEGYKSFRLLNIKTFGNRRSLMYTDSYAPRESRF